MNLKKIKNELLGEELTDKEIVLLIDIINKFIGTFDANLLKFHLVNFLGKSFNADKCFIADYDQKKKTHLVPEYEFMYSSEIKSVKGYDLEKESPELLAIANKGEEIIFSDLNKYIKQKNLAGSKSESFIKSFRVKSAVYIPIKYGQEILGLLALVYVRKKKKFKKNELDLIRKITGQISIALYQIKIHKSLHECLDKEIILKKITHKIRSTLDGDQIKNYFVTLIGQYFKANRAGFFLYDEKTKTFLSCDENSEYLSGTDQVSFTNVDVSKLMPFLQPLPEGKEIIFTDLESYIKEHNLENTEILQVFKSANINSGYKIPVRYCEELKGFFCIEFNEQGVIIEPIELNFLRTLADQFAIALAQSNLCNKIEQTAEKEYLLKEIIYKLKVSHTLDEAYNYILAKIADVFKTDRAFFIETPYLKSKMPMIKYEYLRNKELKSIKGLILPESLLNILKPSINKFIIFISEDFRKQYRENQELQNFAEEYQISSLAVSPLIPINPDTTSFGLIGLTSSTSRQWSKSETELLKTIIEPLVSVIWEIMKLKEIEELRDSFILTLAHDLQVPLIGKNKVIEFLLSRPDDSKIGDYKSFMRTMLKDNEEIICMLKSLLNIYKYEAGKKKLNPEKSEISNLIKETVNSLNELAEKKSITVSVDIQEDLPDLYIDKKEIEKAIFVFLENALTYTQENGFVEIKCYQAENNIITAISDTGPGIPEDIEKKMFQRYAMLKIIERGIGSGLGIYLAKQIIDAHNGRLWYKTQRGKGTTFYFSLPFSA